MNLPQAFTERMSAILGNEYEDFIASYNDVPAYSGIRINTLKPNAKSAVLNIIGNAENVPWCEEGFYTHKQIISGTHPYHLAGLFYFQEPSAMTAVSALPICEGDFVLDLCAAPGGKTTQAGAKLNNTGLLVANEIIKKRADILCENVERMGLTNTVVTNESPAVLAQKYPEFFDKIIVDAPCSGEGMFRKEAAAVTDWSVEHVQSCAQRQKLILDCAVQMLKKDGMLLYSTCTFSMEENEKNARYLMEEKGLTLLPISLEGASTGIDMPEAARIFPHKQKGEGHFAALFKKEYGDENTITKKSANTSAAEKLYRAFESESLNIRLDGNFYLFGSKLYLLPVNLDIDKIKVLRPGLFLGECKKDRFEPSHGLALALEAKDFKRTLDLKADSDALSQYLHGNVLAFDEKGYTAVLVDGFPIGWGKASGGVLKNHFPKKLRL